MSSPEFSQKVQNDKSISQNRELLESYLRNMASKPGFSRISGVQAPQGISREIDPVSLMGGETNQASSKLNSLVLRKNSELAEVIFELQHPEISEPDGRSPKNSRLQKLK